MEIINFEKENALEFKTAAKELLPERIMVFGVIYKLRAYKEAYGTYNLGYYSLKPNGGLNADNKIFEKSYPKSMSINQVIIRYKSVMATLNFTVLSNPEVKLPIQKDRLKNDELKEYINSVETLFGGYKLEKIGEDIKIRNALRERNLAYNLLSVETQRLRADNKLLRVQLAEQNKIMTDMRKLLYTN